jgi:hypothetical protein
MGDVIRRWLPSNPILKAIAVRCGSAFISKVIQHHASLGYANGTREEIAWRV